VRRRDLLVGYWPRSFALSEVALAEMVEEEEGVPPLHLPCREVFGRGGRAIVVDGPVDLASATDVHQGVLDLALAFVS
jgi:hypothetical protein